MFTYRLYTLDEARRVVSCTLLEAGNDAAAVRLAEALQHAGELAMWQSTCLIWERSADGIARLHLRRE